MSSFPSELIRAGAGAGKTKTLIDRLFQFYDFYVAQNQREPNIVMTTFTRKATEELRERMIVRALQENREDLLSFCSSRSKVNITTIHGLLNLYLRRYGAAFDLDPNFLIVRDQDLEGKEKWTLRQLMLEFQGADGLIERYGFYGLLSLVKKIACQLSVAPSYSPIDFGDLKQIYGARLAAWRDDIQRAVPLIRENLKSESWFNFADLLNEIATRLQILMEDPSISSERERVLELLSQRKPSQRKGDAVPTEVSDFISTVWNDLKEFRDESFSTEHWPDLVGQLRILAELAQRFNESLWRYKKQAGLLTMSDLETLALKLLREDPDLAAKFSDDFDYWLIDEFQDTSPIQVQIFDSFIKSKAHFIVGDPQQSIYLFRGARSEVFAQKESEFKKQDFKLSFLQKNYRSTPQLLRFINYFFEKVSKQFNPMVPKDESTQPSPVATFLRAATEEEELSYLGRIVQHLSDTGVPANEIAILGRTHRDLLEITRYLEGLGWAVQLHSNRGFYSTREVRDALAFLKFLVNPHDDVNLILLLRSPFFKCDPSWLFEALQEFGFSHWQKVTSYSAKQTAAAPVRALMGYLSRLQDESISQVFVSGLTEVGFLDVSHFHDNTGQRESNLWKLVLQLREAERRAGFNIVNFINQTMGVLGGEAGDDEIEAASPSEPNRIQLMTVHASKGLQFRHVILPRLSRAQRESNHLPMSVCEETRRWGLTIPSVRIGERVKSLFDRKCLLQFRAREKQESERVLYVAVTRAIEHVWFLAEGEVEKNSWRSMIPEALFDSPIVTEGFSTRTEVPIVDENLRSDLKSGEGANVRALWQLGDTTERGYRRVSVSNLIERPTKSFAASDSVSRPTFRSEIVIRSARAIERGVKLHRWFEALKFHSQEDLLEIIKSHHPQELLDLREILDFFHSQSALPIFDIIRNGQVEWGFLHLFDDVILEGQIDLWGQIGEKIWIVDYKSGSRLDLEKAFRQLDVYSLVIQSKYKAAQVSLVVIETDGLKITERAAAPIHELKQDIKGWLNRILEMPALTPQEGL